MKTLSKTQRNTLLKLTEPNRHSAYSLRVSLSTLYALEVRQLVDKVGIGHGFFPSNGEWRLTAAGKLIADKLYEVI